LAWVSCSSASACVAVGNYTNRKGTTSALAEAWNGTSWALQATPNPTGAEASSLSAVSCTSASACTAVGNLTNAGGSHVTLAEVWDGTSWQVQTTPDPAGARASGLSGVSCTSASACTAVGNYTNAGGNQVTLAEEWNGSSWQVQTTASPTGAEAGSLSDVSCTSPGGCTAVGNYTTAGPNQFALAEAWNGRRWRVETTPPGGASSLSGVSCTSQNACTAVGGSMAEAWNGTSWQIQSTPNTGGGPANLVAVSCTSQNACTAVGEYPSFSGDLTLAEAWNGTSWQIQGTPNPGGFQMGDFGVSCTSASACVAVASYQLSFVFVSNHVTLGETWNGTSWTLQTTRNVILPRPSLLEGVSCATASECTAVGQYTSGTSENETLAALWNSTSWRIQQTPAPGFSTNLTAVSCASASACTAVGWAEGCEYCNPVALAERWNGTSWEVQATPASVFLRGVSCPSSSKCVAVGDSGNAEGILVPGAEEWNGTRWKIQAMPNPSGASASFLLGVSCSSGSKCVAVGYSVNAAGTDVTLAEAWNGTSWQVQAPIIPTAAQASSLSGVSCASKGACTAVGDYTNAAGIRVTLVEAWNGTSWQVQATPNPLGAQASSLSSVSCTSTSACIAVGDYTNAAGIQVTLAEAWNRTSWQIQATPNPPSAQASSLSSVSCTSTSACTAVGDYTNRLGSNVTLVERYIS
jgi:hypothetical protein